MNEQLDAELHKLRSRKQEANLGEGGASSTTAGSEGGVAGVLNPITAATKSLARKVVSLAPSSSNSIIPSAATFVGVPRAPSPTPNEPTAENLDDCMRKVNKYVRTCFTHSIFFCCVCSA